MSSTCPFCLGPSHWESPCEPPKKRAYPIINTTFVEVKDDVEAAMFRCLREGLKSVDAYSLAIAPIVEGVRDYTFVFHEIDNGLVLIMRPVDRRLENPLHAYQMKVEFPP